MSSQPRETSAPTVFRRIDDAVFAIEQGLVAVMLVVMTVIVFLDVVYRQLIAPESEISQWLSVVIADPAHRSQGHARAAVALVARLALGRGLVLQYRTLEANTPSRRIADSLGFVHYATSLAIRFL